MAALRYAMRNLANARALQRLRASPVASAPRSMSAGVPLPPKHHCTCAAAGTATHGDHGGTPVKQLNDDDDDPVWRVVSYALALAGFIGTVTGVIPKRFRDQGKAHGVAGYGAALPTKFRDEAKVQAVAGDGVPKTDLADD